MRSCRYLDGSFPLEKGVTRPCLWDPGLRAMNWCCGQFVSPCVWGRAGRSLAIVSPQKPFQEKICMGSLGSETRQSENCGQGSGNPYLLSKPILHATIPSTRTTIVGKVSRVDVTESLSGFPNRVRKSGKQPADVSMRYVDQYRAYRSRGARMHECWMHSHDRCSWLWLRDLLHWCSWWSRPLQLFRV
ncbi:hypothetical protein K432DRAFT_203885 [Lepidopterella palustris CBS 459.81]|uniref:Uncharacterized protein n=1 Tax=Lepidopterella palustris CBS 459.81 TaxID=1314670 RepID=A0A8E2JA11_9PEZI|nr:hypothetical protein K432DRAFT_203885 [Lepidopterella palustris CBS 459.81]